jgi:hypothetical protein
MTTAADDTADEAAFGAFLAGRPVPGETDGGSSAVAAFAGAVRATATLPGRPNAALADLLATGLLTDQSSPSIRTAPSAGSSPRRSRVRRRRRFAMIFPALLAKFLSAGAVAQAASGAGICLVAFTGAGAAGVLPDPVQETFSSVVGTETADETTVPEDTTGTGTGDVVEVENPALATPVDVAPTDLTLEDWEKGPAPDQSFGDWVSDGARHGYADGKTISEWAHTRNEDRHRGAAESTPATPTDAPEVEDDHSTTESGSHHGGGHGADDGGHDSGDDGGSHGGSGLGSGSGGGSGFGGGSGSGGGNGGGHGRG